MDEESSYESDISESWSLIDINLYEESLSSAEVSTLLKKSPSSELKNVNLGKRDEIELEDFVKKSKEIKITDIRGVSDSDSDSSFKNNDVATCSKQGLNGRKPTCKKSLDDGGKYDSGDTESIEILDLDGHQDSETDKLDISLINRVDSASYQSDEEESCEEGVSIGDRINISTVIKRRHRLNRNADDIVHSVNCETRLAKNNFKTCSSDTKEESHIIDKSNSMSNYPVYKHYRNNVANTFLSLSVGIIFAGVACIAIGHFLGVQNAAESAVELAETLKKLQMENAALQSRLFHLNRVIHSQGMNSKELPVNQPPRKASCEKAFQDNPSKTPETDLNNAVLSEIRSSLKSIEWLSKIKDFLQTNRRGPDGESELSYNEFGKYIHDQLHILKKRQEEGAKLFEDTNKNISKVLQKIINRLLSSHDNIETIYQRLIQLKNKLNYKLNGILPDLTEGINSEKSKRENRLPVTELDLQTIQWNPKNEIRENSNLCKFPQHEKYYEWTNSNRTFQYEKAQKKNKKKHRQKKDKGKHGKNNQKDERWEREKKGGKEKRVVNKEEYLKKYSRAVFNETKIHNKKYPKLESKDDKPKRRFKKHKKVKGVLLSKLQKDSCFSSKSGRTNSEPQCFNLTGYWMFKWAHGRKEHRRHHTLGDWQFERAKARSEVRDLDGHVNWQFERAKARRNLRDDDFQESLQLKRTPTRETNRNENRWHRGKQTKYNGKKFFHERFSWF